MKRTLLAAGVLPFLLLGPAQAQDRDPDPGPTADVGVAMQGPEVKPLVGTTFRLVYTVSNNGPEAASDTSFSQYIPGELKLESATASAPSDACTPGREAEDTTTEPPPPPPPAGAAPEADGTASGEVSPPAPGYYGDSVSCLFGTLPAGETRVVTLELTRIGARSTYTSAWVGSSLNDSNYENNYADLQLEPDTSNPADVGITIDSPKNPAVGSTFTYTLTVTNHGPSVASASLFNPIGYGLGLVGVDAARADDQCETTDYSDPESPSPAYAGYSEVYCELAPIEAGKSATIAVTVERATAYEIWSGASVQTTNYDEGYENDYASFYVEADPSVTSDLSVTTTAPESTPLVGETFEVAMDVGNAGPAPATDAWLSTHLPPGIELVSVAPENVCSEETYGPMPMADAPTAAPTEGKSEPYYPVFGGMQCAIGSIAPGGNAHIDMTFTRTSAKEIWTSAWLWSTNHDPNYENNYSDLQIAPDKSNPADVGLSVGAPQKPAVGESFAIELNVTNAGPADAKGVVATNYLPYGLDGNSVSSSDPSDSCVLTEDNWDEPRPMAPAFYMMREVRCDLGTMAAGEETKISIDVTRTSEYEIWESAWVYTDNYDENYDNDYASVLIEGEPYPGACPAQGDLEGTAASDDFIIGPCYAETAGGADSVNMVPPSSGDSGVRTGSGNDSINVNLSIGSSTSRAVRVVGGSGRDRIRIAAAPGVGNAVVTILGGAGADTIEVDIPAGVTGLRIEIRGGKGKDRVLWTGTEGEAGGRVPGLRVYGGAGVDLLEGGLGNDMLDGGPNGDRLFGNLGDDVLRGGAGYDVCRGGPGQDRTSGC